MISPQILSLSFIQFDYILKSLSQRMDKIYLLVPRQDINKFMD